MLAQLADYVGTWEDDLNTDIMDKTYDDELVSYIADVWESLEVVKYIKFLGYDFNRRESQIDINRHVFRRTAKTPKKERYKIKLINDTRCGLFTAHIKIILEELDPKTGESILREKLINKDMLIPIADENGYYHINGKKYYMIYQLTEKSTYNTNNANVLKSLMSVVVCKDMISASDTEGNSYMLPVYSTFVYKRKNPILLYMFANEGVSVSLMELRIQDVVRIVDSDLKDPDCIYFNIDQSHLVEVNRELFQSYQYVKAMVGSIIDILCVKTDFTRLDDCDQFVCRLTASGTIEKGNDNLTSFNRMMDKTTKKILQLDEYHKSDVYAVLRWMMFEYDDLRMKDNIDLKNKRLRCNEYVSSLLTLEFSNKLTRIISLGSKVTMEQIVDIFKFPGDILLKKMYNSGILRFDETINDMDFFSKFKWTLKGPHSLGNKNENTIMTQYRACHPSFIGNLDLLTCGNSDPGTAGILSPFCKMNSLYFDRDGEPDEFIFNFTKDVKRILNTKGIETLDISFDSPKDYYRILSYARNFVNENISVYGTSRDQISITFVKDDDMIAEHLRSENSFWEDDNEDDGSLEIIDVEE